MYGNVSGILCGYLLLVTLMILCLCHSMYYIQATESRAVFGPHDAYLQHLMPMTIVHNLHLVVHVGHYYMLM